MVTLPVILEEVQNVVSPIIPPYCRGKNNLTVRYYHKKKDLLVYDIAVGKDSSITERLLVVEEEHKVPGFLRNRLAVRIHWDDKERIVKIISEIKVTTTVLQGRSIYVRG